MNKAALEAVITAKSPLNLSQVERLFGGDVTEENKSVVWRFLNMTHAQQTSIWQGYLRVKDEAPGFQVEAVR